jgi:hypothetical protein
MEYRNSKLTFQTLIPQHTAITFINHFKLKKLKLKQL